jgi:hypothetical protein
MKILSIIAFAFLLPFGGMAQRVLVGSGTPVQQAMLEVRSTNSGVLIPRMTSTQRIGIASPVAGLLLFDSTVNRIYGRDASFWRYFLDDSYWKLTNSNSKVYNLTDSIGINTSSPDERLHLFSDMRLNNGNATLTESSGSNSKIIFDYTGTGVNGYSHQLNFLDGGIRRGNLQFINSSAAGQDKLVLDIASTSLNVQSNGVTYFDAASPTIQLQTTGIDKGFVQIAGNDFRIGTNSSNDNGRFIVRSNSTERLVVNSAGNVGINTTNPQYKLHVLGNVKSDFNLATAATAEATNIRLVTELNKPATTGNANLLPFGYGKVAGLTAVCSCSRNDISVSGIGSGNYFIKYPGMLSYDVIIINNNTTNTWVSYYYESSTVGFRVLTWNNSFGGSNVGNFDFSFIIFKQ